jgi:hypothetical protein
MMQTLEKLKLLQTFTGHSLRNADGLRYPYNLDKINKMVKEIVKDYDNATLHLPTEAQRKEVR